MGAKEVQRIGTAMAQARERFARGCARRRLPTSPQTVESQTSVGVGADEFLRKVLVDALGQDKAANIIDRINIGRSTKGLEALKWMDSRSVAELIRQRAPADHRHRARLPGSGPGGRGAGATCRPTCAPDVMRASPRSTACSRARSPSSTRSWRSSSPASPAARPRRWAAPRRRPTSSISSSRARKARSWSRSRRATRRSRARIQDLVFVFDNLIDLDDRGMQELLRQVPGEQAAARLKGCGRAAQGEDLQEHVAARGRDAARRPGGERPGAPLRSRGARRRRSCRSPASWPRKAPSRSAARARNMSEARNRRQCRPSAERWPPAGRRRPASSALAAASTARGARRHARGRCASGVAAAQGGRGPRLRGRHDAARAPRLARGWRPWPRARSASRRSSRLLARPLEQLDAEIESELAQLALAVGKQLARRELRIEPAQVIAILREALALLPAAAREVRVHLHPEDAATVREHLTTPASERAWTIVEDPTLSRGGCVVHSQSSRIDARLEARIAAVAASTLGDERARRARAGHMSGVASSVAQRPHLRARRLQRRLRAVAGRAEPPAVEGTLTRMVGLTLEAAGCQASVGDYCDVIAGDGSRTSDGSGRLCRRPAVPHALRAMRMAWGPTRASFRASAPEPSGSDPSCSGASSTAPRNRWMVSARSPAAPPCA